MSLEVAGRWQVEARSGTGDVEAGRRLGLVVIHIEISNFWNQRIIRNGQST